MKKGSVALGVVIFVVVGVIAWSYLFLRSGSGIGGSTADISFSGNATNTSVDVGVSLNVATSTILDANADRNFAYICNTGATTTYACLHSSACAFGNGIPLNPRLNATTTPNCFEINRNNLYTGRIIGVVQATSSTTTVSVVER